MQQHYPFLWDQINEDAGAFMDEPDEGMEEMTHTILRITKGPKNREETLKGLEDAFHKTYQQGMRVPFHEEIKGNID